MRLRALVVALLVLLAPAAAWGKRSLAPGAVELNSATLLDLMQLPGVGRMRAEQIVQRRQARPFKRPAELLEIPGIGRRIFLRLKPYVRVGEQAADHVPAKPAP